MWRLWKKNKKINGNTFYGQSAAVVHAFLSMFLAAGMLAVIAFSETRQRRTPSLHLYWWGLSLIFLFLACDEAIMLHERLIEPIRDRFHLSGFFYYAWVLPYGIFALIIFALYLRFLLRLPREIAWLLVISGSMYVGGALGMEMVGGWYVEQHLGAEHTVRHSQIEVAFQTVEESLEMMGIVVFIYTLARYAAGNGGLALSLRSGE